MIASEWTRRESVRMWKSGMSHRRLGGTVAVVMLLSGLACRPLLVFLVPGFLVLFFPFVGPISLPVAIAHVAGVSAAFWVCLFWFLKYIPVPLHVAFWGVVGGAAVLALYRVARRRPICLVSCDLCSVLGMAIIAWVVALRFLPLTQCLAPAGADMSMHAYITELMLRKDGVPDSYRPILGIDRFDTFPVGFHTLSALVSMTGNLPAYRGTFVVTCATYALLTATLFVFLNVYLEREYAWIASLCFTFVTCAPQGYVEWGGNPTILALVFLALFLTIFEQSGQRRPETLIIGGLFLAAVLLTHTLVFLPAAYAFGIPFLVVFLWDQQVRGAQWRRGLVILSGVVFVSLPYLMAVDLGTDSPATREWIRHWVRDTPHAWHGSFRDFAWTVPLYILNGFGQIKGLLLPLAVGFVVLARTRRRVWVQYTLVLIVLILLIVSTRYWVLPFAFAVYPERTATMAILPFGLLLGTGIQSLFSLLSRRTPWPKLPSTIRTCFLVVLVWSLWWFNEASFAAVLRNETSVTSADLTAFEWLDQQAPADAVIENNYGDAGIWIPAIVFRPVTSPHTNVAYLDKRTRLPAPKYAYIGPARVYECQLEPRRFLSDPTYRVVYHRGGVWIFERVR